MITSHKLEVGFIVVRQKKTIDGNLPFT